MPVCEILQVPLRRAIQVGKTLIAADTTRTQGEKLISAPCYHSCQTREPEKPVVAIENRSLSEALEPLSALKAGMALKSIIPVWQKEVNLSVRVIILKYLARNITCSSGLPEATRTTS